MMAVMWLFLVACVTSAPKDGAGPCCDTATPGADGGAPTDGGGQPGTGDGGGSGEDGGGSGGDGGGADGGTEPLSRPPAVVLFIGDGMGEQHLLGASLRAAGREGALRMQTAPWQGWLRTASLSGLTDSAAAVTAMATGSKTWNGRLGLDGEGRPLRSLLRQAADAGLGTGVLSSDTLTGATPAAFLAQVEDRGSSAEIVSQVLAAPPDLLIGGGRDVFLSAADPKRLQILTEAGALAHAADDGRPLLALLAERSFDYRVEDATAQPSLAELSRFAAERLLAHESGFFLLVEGARIDHASHGNRSDAVHLETLDFDEAIGAIVELAAAHPEREWSVLVTADHECGGLRVESAGAVGEDPVVSWRWTDHTNERVPVFAWGERLAALHAVEADNRLVHALLAAAIAESEPEAPEELAVLDGHLAEFGPALATQAWATDFGEGYNQLDGLRLRSDEDGLWIGLDGVFDDEANALIVWVDRDLGEGTGVGAGLVLVDGEGELDALLGRLAFEPTIDGLGFDAALGQLRGTYLLRQRLGEEAGLRLFAPPHGEAADLWWLDAGLNFAPGSLARGLPAPAAGPTGETVDGAEAFLPWSSLFPGGLPAEGTRLGVFAMIVDATGATCSNQALPAYASEAPPSPASIPVDRVGRIDVDGSGRELSPAEVWP